ncbi:hypothetical protein ACP4OV_018753 [Aristida adscensionis]
MHEMAGQSRLLLTLALLLVAALLATAVVGEDEGNLAGADDDARPAAAAGGSTLDVRSRKWSRFPATEGLVRGSERRVPNSSDPLHNR